MSNISEKIRDPSYYENIGRIMNAMTGEEIRLTPEDIEKRENKIADLEEIINSPDVWEELVEKYKTPGNKINYANCHSALLRHNHVKAIRSLGKNYDLDNFTFSYYHKDELIRQVVSGTGDIMFGLSSGNPTEGTMYIGNTFQVFLSEEMLPTEDFMTLGRSVYSHKDLFTIPTWELELYGAVGIVPESCVNVAKVNSLKYYSKNKQYDMNHAVLWSVSKGIVSRNGSVPIRIYHEFKTFPDKAVVWDIENPNAKLDVSNDLSEHCRRILEKSEEMSETIKHAFRKLFTVLLVITVKSKSPKLYDNILCTLLTRLKQVSDKSGVSIVGMNVDCIEVTGDILEEFVGKDPGMFKLVESY